MNYVVAIIFYTVTVVFITGYFCGRSYIFESSFYGVIDGLRFGTRDVTAGIIKFKGTDDYNKSIIFIIPQNFQSKLKKGDSISKPMFSMKAYIYRNDSIINVVKVK